MFFGHNFRFRKRSRDATKNSLLSPCALRTRARHVCVITFSLSLSVPTGLTPKFLPGHFLNCRAPSFLTEHSPRSRSGHRLMTDKRWSLSPTASSVGKNIPDHVCTLGPVSTLECSPVFVSYDRDPFWGPGQVSVQWPQAECPGVPTRSGSASVSGVTAQMPCHSQGMNPDGGDDVASGVSPPGSNRCPLCGQAMAGGGACPSKDPAAGDARPKPRCSDGRQAGALLPPSLLRLPAGLNAHLCFQRTKEKFKPGKCLTLRSNGKWETELAFRLNSKQNGVIKTESLTVKFTHVKGTSQWCVVYSQSRASLSPNSRIFHHPKGRPAPTPQQPQIPLLCRICRRGHLQAQDPTAPSPRGSDDQSTNTLGQAHSEKRIYYPSSSF